MSCMPRVPANSGQDDAVWTCLSLSVYFTVFVARADDLAAVSALLWGCNWLFIVISSSMWSLMYLGRWGWETRWFCGWLEGGRDFSPSAAWKGAGWEGGNLNAEREDLLKQKNKLEKAIKDLCVKLAKKEEESVSNLTQRLAIWRIGRRRRWMDSLVSKLKAEKAHLESESADLKKHLQSEKDCWDMREATRSGQVESSGGWNRIFKRQYACWREFLRI